MTRKLSTRERYVARAQRYPDGTFEATRAKRLIDAARTLRDDLNDKEFVYEHVLNSHMTTE